MSYNFFDILKIVYNKIFIVDNFVHFIMKTKIKYDMNK